jgi:hypothetical protein
MQQKVSVNLEDSTDYYLAKLELINEECGFSHGPEHLIPKKPQAVNYVCQYFGNIEGKQVTEQLRIPTCQECIDGLKDSNWVIIYCVGCNSSQWIYKPTSKLDFPQKMDILWVDLCPKCKKGGNLNAEI